MTMDPPMYFFFCQKNMEFASESDPPGPNPSPIFLGKESMLQGFSLREEHVSPESWKNMGEIHRKIRRTIRRKIHRTSVQNLREIIWKTMESCLRIWDFWTFLDIASLSTCSYWDQTTFHVKKARYCNSFNFFSCHVHFTNVNTFKCGKRQTVSGNRATHRRKRGPPSYGGFPGHGSTPIAWW